MSKNPIEAYLGEKTAAQTSLPFGGFGHSFGNAMRQGLNPSRLGESAANAVLGAGGAALAAGAVAGGVRGVQALYDVATEARDFRAMLENDPDLKRKHEEEPKLVNRMFTTLRTFNPAFTRDPVVAGSYVRQMVEDPMHAGTMATEALNFRDKTRNQLGDRVTQAAFQRAHKP